jgi:hypothetical protein
MSFGRRAAAIPPDRKSMKRKTFIICNEHDRPCTKLVAEIIENDPESEYVKARYLTVGSSICTVYARRDRLRYVEDFGVELFFANGTVTGIQTGPSKAAYPNGAPRRWQPESNETWALKQPVRTDF